MKSSKVAAATGALAALVGACGNGGTPSGAAGTGGATGASTGAGTTTCTEPACMQLIECCNTGNFVDQTQANVCVGFANNCSQCDTALSTYVTIGTCKATSTSASSSSGGSASASSSSSSSASSSSSSSGACGLPDGAGKMYVGLVELGLVAAGAAPAQHTVLGEFTAAPANPPPTCAGTQAGACCYQPAGGGTPTFQSAGTLKITDGAKTLATLTAPPYLATSATLPALTWAAGNTLKVAGSGGTVDAFSLSVVAPGQLAGVSPAFTSTPIDVSKSAKLVVSWTPSSKACSQVTFSLSQLPATPALPYIGCVAADSDGTLTVPASLLTKLTATTGTATIERVESAGVLVGNADVKVVAVNGHTASVSYQ